MLPTLHDSGEGLWGGRPQTGSSRGAHEGLMLGLWWATVWSHLIGVLREPPPMGIRSHLPFSSKANTEVCPTDTCFNLCLGGGGMWYQQSPAVGDGLRWDLEAPHLSPRCPQHTWPFLQLAGSSGCSQPLSPDQADHTGDRAQRELT